MSLPFYLAMTDREFHSCARLPQRIGWLSCRFSHRDGGLTGIPSRLPPDSVLFVCDLGSPQDPRLVANQLQQAAKSLSLFGIALDFQRPYDPSLAGVAQAVSQALSCPVAVTPPYAHCSDGPLLLPPIPADGAVREILKSHRDRPLWLETECQGVHLTLTAAGCSCQPLQQPLQDPVFYCPECISHYCASLSSDRADFFIRRTHRDQEEFLRQANALGVTLAVGLYQQQVLFVHPGS